MFKLRAMIAWLIIAITVKTIAIVHRTLQIVPSITVMKTIQHLHTLAKHPITHHKSPCINHVSINTQSWWVYPFQQYLITRKVIWHLSLVVTVKVPVTVTITVTITIVLRIAVEVATLTLAILIITKVFKTK